MQALEHGFLDGGFAPLRLDEDAAAVAAMMVVAVAKAGGTYEIPERRVSFINASKMRIPFFLVRSYWREVELPRQAD
jgi:hypothetical protein